MARCLHIVLAVTCWVFCSVAFAHVPEPAPAPMPIPHPGVTFAHLPMKKISLREAVMLSVRMNPGVKSAYLQRITDKFSLEVARNEFEPKYRLDGTATWEQNRTAVYRMNPAVSLKTPLGTEINLEVDKQIDGANEATGTFTLRQPLLRNAGLAVVLASLHNAQDSEVINCLSLRNQVIGTITQVIQSYNALIQDYKNLEVDKLALKDSLRTLDSTKLKIKAGKVPETEVTQQNAQVANQRFAVTRDENNIKRDYQNFLLVLGLDPRSHLGIEKDPFDRDLFIPEKEKCVNLAMANNIDFQSRLIQLRQQEREVVVQKNQQLPELNLNVSASEDLTNGIAGERRITLNLSVPIDDKPRQQGLVNAKVGLKRFHVDLQNARRQLETDVINAIRDLEAQRQQIKLAEQSVHYSEESLKIAQKKFEYGRTTMFEITSLRRTLTVNQLNLINQRIGYLNTFAQFEQILGISIERWGLSVCC